MDIILWIIWAGTYLFGAVRFELYIVHMFQQNSYKPAEYREWLRVKSNVGRLLGKTLYAFVSLPLLLLGGRGCLIAACLLNVMTILVNKPRHAKKPLVYTARVKRMLVTTGILFAVAAIAAAVLTAALSGVLSGSMWKNTGAFVLAVLFVLIPVCVLLVNRLNHPIEQGINQIGRAHV